MSDSNFLRAHSEFTLGIDIGSSSLGTALVRTETEQIAFLGVRIFPAGVEGRIEEGKENPAPRSGGRRGSHGAKQSGGSGGSTGFFICCKDGVCFRRGGESKRYTRWIKNSKSGIPKPRFCRGFYVRVRSITGWNPGN
jgi:hypothetical protein